MAAQKNLNAKEVDQLLKALLVLARSTQQILEAGAVKSAINKPLSASKLQVLRLLGMRGAHMASQVARFLGVSKPAVTQTIDSMVKDRVVSRRTAKTSRREVTLTLTAKGTKQFRAIQQRQRHLLRLASRESLGGRAKTWVDTVWQISKALTQADRTFTHICLQCGAHEDASCVLKGGHADCLFLLQKDLPKNGSVKRKSRSKART